MHFKKVMTEDTKVSASIVPTDDKLKEETLIWCGRRNK